MKTLEEQTAIIAQDDRDNDEQIATLGDLAKISRMRLLIENLRADRDVFRQQRDQLAVMIAKLEATDTAELKKIKDAFAVLGSLLKVKT